MKKPKLALLILLAIILCFATGCTLVTSKPQATYYTVKFMNGETELQSVEVEYGSIPEYTGATPTKEATAQYTYTFNGWDNELVAVTDDATYNATFTETVNKYTVTWKDGDGNTLETDENVEYGTMPTYDSTTPT